ncbi:SLC45 family MFS transporter [Bacillaceae bacterium SIJ1]|nr:SLC45 family MFS transporter [Litoribacterium kuwaitense]
MDDKKRSFSYRQIFVIGTGFLAMMLVWTFYNAFMPLVLSEYIDSSALRGIIMGLDNLLAVLLIPWIGAWSDRISTPFGQRLPFIIVGMPLAALLFVLLPLVANISLGWLLIIDIAFLIAMTLYRAPVIALMPDVTPQNKRSSANGIINLLGGIGAMIALFGLSAVYDVSRTFAFGIGSIVLITVFLLLFWRIDRQPPYAEKASEASEESQSLRVLTKALKALINVDFRGPLLILSGIFFYFIGYSGIEAQFTTFAVGYLQLSSGEAGTTLGIFSLSFVLFAVPAGFLGNRFGKSRMMQLGLAILIVLFSVVPFLPNVLSIQILLFFAGFGWALVNVQAYAFVADLGGKAQIGYMTGLYYFFSMASSLIAPGLAGLFMDLFTLPSLFFVASISFGLGFVFLNAGAKKTTKSGTQVEA